MYLSTVLTDFESCVDFDFLADLELDFEFFEEVLENCELSDDWLCDCWLKFVEYLLSLCLDTVILKMKLDGKWMQSEGVYGQYMEGGT